MPFFKKKTQIENPTQCYSFQAQKKYKNFAPGSPGIIVLMLEVTMSIVYATCPPMSVLTFQPIYNLVYKSLIGIEPLTLTLHGVNGHYLPISSVEN